MSRRKFKPDSYRKYSKRRHFLRKSAERARKFTKAAPLKYETHFPTKNELKALQTTRLLPKSKLSAPKPMVIVARPNRPWPTRRSLLDAPTNICRDRATRRALIIKSGYGGINKGIYKPTRSKIKCDR